MVFSIINLIYYKDTYVFGRGESEIKFPNTIIINNKGEDVTDWFDKQDSLIQYYLIESKQCKYKFLWKNEYLKILKEHNDEHNYDRNDVYIYKTILYPPESTPPKASLQNN